MFIFFSNSELLKYSGILNKLVYDYLYNKNYQEDIEFIFQNSQNIFSYGFQKFYLADLEEVYLIQRRYKELYYIYKNR